MSFILIKFFFQPPAAFLGIGSDCCQKSSPVSRRNKKGAAEPVPAYTENKKESYYVSGNSFFHFPPDFK